MALSPDAKLVDKSGIGLGQLRSRGMMPKSFEVVKLPHRLIKNMHDDVCKIHQDPLAPAHALDRQGMNTHGSEVSFDSLSDALNLSIRAA